MSEHDHTSATAGDDPSEESASDLLATDVESPEAAGEPPHPRRRAAVVVAAVVAVAAVAAGGYALASYLGGGGTQPEDVLPAGVVAFADVDLDPSAAQKASVAQFLARFDGFDERLSDEQGVRAVLLDALLSGTDGDPSDVEGWLGDRFGAAVLPGSGTSDSDLDLSATPQAALVIQVTDEQAAQEWATQHLGADRTSAVSNGYLVVATGGTDAEQIVADGVADPLATSAAFQQAMAGLGSGVASVYLDPQRLTDIVSQLGVTAGLTGESESGPIGMVLSVNSDGLELRGQATGLDTSTASSGSVSDLLDGLPTSTGVAVGVAGLGELGRQRWDQALAQSGLSPQMLDRELASLRRQTGLDLPTDLATLLGDQLVVGVDGTGLARDPQAGVVVITDPSKAARLVDTVAPWVAEASGGYGFSLAATDTGWVAATSETYATLLTSGPGGLLSQPQVATVLPDVDSATAVVYLDLDALAEAAAASDASQVEVLSPLRAFGLTVTVEADSTRIHGVLTVD